MKVFFVNKKAKTKTNLRNQQIDHVSSISSFEAGNVVSFIKCVHNDVNALWYPLEMLWNEGYKKKLLMIKTLQEKKKKTRSLF